MRTGWRWFLAFSFLLLAVHEAHELAHAVVGRMVCGEWPLRDFNAWHFVHDCSSVLPTAAGPLFSYAIMVIGALLARTSPAAGAAVLFAANPFARIFTAAMGGGDEMLVAQRLLGLTQRTWPLRIGVLVVLLAICGSAIFVGWRAMRRPLWFITAMLWPMILTGVLLFVVGNGLLRRGVLAQPVITGAPLLVIVVSAAAAVMTVLTFRWMFSDESQSRAS
ncbi:MAG TPA: hypothetical protein VJZ00_21845 [Thermoanaerobaculia bacterium]|nr:hypothetical protein [Thermoanaerobaculia bacterium]